MALINILSLFGSKPLIRSDFTKKMNEDSDLLFQSVFNMADEKTKKVLQKTQEKYEKSDKKILEVNKKILAVLEKIERNMIDEQDTSIKRASAIAKPKERIKEVSSNQVQTTTDDSISVDFDRDKRPKIKDSKKPKTKDSKKPEKPKTKGFGTKFKKFGKFLKLGKATGLGAVALTAYDAYQGFSNASEILGLDEKYLNTFDKSVAGVGNVINEIGNLVELGIKNNPLTMFANGLSEAVRTKDLSKIFSGFDPLVDISKNLFSGNFSGAFEQYSGLFETSDYFHKYGTSQYGKIRKFEELGILNHNILGNSEIKDWEKVKNLSDDDLAQLIAINDFSESDLQKLKFAKTYNKLNTDAIQADSAKEEKTITSELEKTNIVSDKKTVKTSDGEFRLNGKSPSKDIINIDKSEYRKVLKSNDKELMVRAIVMKQTKEDFRKKVTPSEEYFEKKFKEVDERMKVLEKPLDIQLMEDFKEFLKQEYNKFKTKTIEENPTSKKSKSSPVIIKASTVSNVTPFTSLSFGASQSLGLASSRFEQFNLKPSNMTFDPNSRIGILSEKYEVGKRGVATISSGRGDPGGKSYGTWQLSSNAGTLGAYIRSKESGQYGEQLRKYPIASADFDKAWKACAEQDPKGFEKSQYDFLYRANYLNVLSHAKGLGIDTNSFTMQNVLWSQAIQHGLYGNKKILNEAVKAVGKGATTESLINAIYNSRAQYVSTLDLPTDTKQSLLNRYVNEGSDALGMLQQESTTTSNKGSQVAQNLQSNKQPLVSQVNMQTIASKNQFQMQSQNQSQNFVSLSMMNTEQKSNNEIKDANELFEMF